MRTKVEYFNGVVENHSYYKGNPQARGLFREAIGLIERLI